MTALKHEGVDCAGVVAHVGIDDDRRKLIDFALERYCYQLILFLY